MIECTNERIYKRRRGKHRKAFSFFIVILFIALPFLYTRFCIAETVGEICSDACNAYSLKAANAAAISSLSLGVSYSEIVNVEKNSSGDITLIGIDPLKANSIGQEITAKTRTNLESELKNGIPLPWLAFSGVKLLAGYGKEVSFKAVTISSVKCELNGKFHSVGINQTLHSIYAAVVCETNIEIPLSKRTETSRTDILIAESVIVGKVPEIYLGGENSVGKTNGKTS